MSKHLLSGDNLNRFEALRQFLGGYFHQDWDMDFDSVEAAIEDFLADADAQVIEATCRDIEQVLTCIDAGAFHRHLLVAFGCYYDPELDGPTQEQWLRSLLDQFRVRLSNT